MTFQSDLNLDFACKYFGFWGFFFKKRNTDWANITAQFEHFELFFHLLDFPPFNCRHSSAVKYGIHKWKEQGAACSQGTGASPWELGAHPALCHHGTRQGKLQLPSQQPQSQALLTKLLLAPGFYSNSLRAEAALGMGNGSLGTAGEASSLGGVTHQAVTELSHWDCLELTHGIFPVSHQLHKNCTKSSDLLERSWAAGGEQQGCWAQ